MAKETVERYEWDNDGENPSRYKVDKPTGKTVQQTVWLTLPGQTPIKADAFSVRTSQIVAEWTEGNVDLLRAKDATS